jgi:hypothetical protein
VTLVSKASARVFQWLLIACAAALIAYWTSSETGPYPRFEAFAEAHEPHNARLMALLLTALSVLVPTLLLLFALLLLSPLRSGSSAWIDWLAHIRYRARQKRYPVQVSSSPAAAEPPPRRARGCRLPSSPCVLAGGATLGRAAQQNAAPRSGRSRARRVYACICRAERQRCTTRTVVTLLGAIPCAVHW